MRATFDALPRDAVNRLEPAAVRYLLHRLFVERRGWYVLGFTTEGDAWNSSSPTAVFGAHEDPSTRHAFEDRLGSHGLSLHEVALLAATLESFVHLEAIDRLRGAYRLLGLPSEEEAEEEQVVSALNTYMMLYVLGMNHTRVSKLELQVYSENIPKFYPHWNATKRWVHEVRREVVDQEFASARTSFDASLRVVEEIGDRYGRFQDAECQGLKASLLKIEQRDTGRVPLGAFYEAALNGKWQFSENTGYLRQLGALDESDEIRPSVVIANYVNSPANCVASSKFYSVCCINECEALLNHLERTMAAPMASPARIAEVVEALPSATVEAPRTLSATLRMRLDEIAAHHGGQVPFHARLFNQWLHHAYPRECPYPHLSGTSKPITPDRWMEQTGTEVAANKTAMQWHVEQAVERAGEDEELGAELPWLEEEELFISNSPMPEVPVAQAEHELGQMVRRVFAMVALASTATVALVRVLSTARDAATETQDTKCFV